MAKDPVALGNQYGQELQTAAEGLRSRAVQLQQSVQEQLANAPGQIEPITQNIIQSVQDQSEISTPPGAIVSTFLWTSVLAVVAGVAFYVGGTVLGGVLHALLGSIGLALAALIGAPAFAYYKLTSAEGGAPNDADGRMLLLAYAAGAGLLLGGAFNATYYYAEPFLVLAPLTVALVFAYGASAIGNSRQNVLGAAVGGGVAVSLLSGMITDSLSTQFFVLTLLYAAATFVTLQFLFQNVKAEDAPTHVYMLAYIATALAAKTVAFFVLGSDRPYADEHKNEEDDK